MPAAVSCGIFVEGVGGFVKVFTIFNGWAKVDGGEVKIELNLVSERRLSDVQMRAGIEGRSKGRLSFVPKCREI